MGKMMTDVIENADLLWGATEIGAFIRKSPRKTFYLLSTGQIPSRKLGRQYVSSKSELLKALAGAPSNEVAAR